MMEVFMTSKKRIVLLAVLLIVTTAIAFGAGQGQDRKFPARDITLIVP